MLVGSADAYLEARVGTHSNGPAAFLIVIFFYEDISGTFELIIVACWLYLPGSFVAKRTSEENELQSSII